MGWLGSFFKSVGFLPDGINLYRSLPVLLFYSPFALDIIDKSGFPRFRRDKA